MVMVVLNRENRLRNQWIESLKGEQSKVRIAGNCSEINCSLSWEISLCQKLKQESIISF